jgi:hemerythrin-like domain-containing protein
MYSCTSRHFPEDPTCRRSVNTRITLPIGKRILPFVKSGKLRKAASIDEPLLTPLNKNMQQEPSNTSGSTDRRQFVKKGLVVTLTGVAGIGLLAGCKGKDEDEGQEVSPPEDLMQEHGLLNRVLLIYDTCRTQLVNKTAFPKDALNKAATVIRTFVEDYHERQEEHYLFPRFQKANQLTDLVGVLLQQHGAGRTLTEEIMQLTKGATTTEAENQRLIQLLDSFNTMYRPHEAREDTVLFPAFRKIVSKNEYDSLGEEFEKNEQKLFGKDGFETMVNKVADIEKSLGIYELAQFTPKR